MVFADLGVNDAIGEAVRPLLKSDIRYLARTMRRRLKSRCTGLLEVGSLEDEQSDLKFLPERSMSSESSSEEGGNVSLNDDGWTSDDGDESAKEDEALTLQEIDILADRKVQYLHRTVKDFLEQPEIWDRIVAATGAKFHPYTALYASYLLQLKSLDLESITKHNYRTR